METITVQEQWDISREIEKSFEECYNGVALHSPRYDYVEVTLSNKTNFIDLHTEIEALNQGNIQHWILDQLQNGDHIRLIYKLA